MHAFKHIQKPTGLSAARLTHRTDRISHSPLGAPILPRGEQTLPDGYVRGAGEAVAETLWPTRCAVCDRPGELICSQCRLQLRYIEWWRACPRCGAPMGRVQCCECNSVMMRSLERDEPGFDAMASVIEYDEAAARIVRTWKDAGERRLCHEMALMMARAAPAAWLAGAPVATPVPATAAALRRRGFDHTAELAQALARLLGITYAETLDRPTTHDQRALGRKGRARNLNGSFKVAGNATVAPYLLLIDDVCTTGATINAAADALREAGAQTIHCLTFARV